MSQFTVSGRYQNRDGYRQFETVVDAPNENVARERIYSTIGSRHNLKRTQIDLGEVTAA